MAVAGMISGIAGQALGTTGKMVGYYMSIKQSKVMERYNQAIADANLMSIERKNNANMERIVDEGRRVKAESVAQYAQSGAVIDSGTPAEVLREQAENIEIDQINALRVGRYRENIAQHQKAMVRINAKNYRAQQRVAGISTLLGSSAQGASTVYQGISK